jgi:hypothetical protein
MNARKCFILGLISSITFASTCRAQPPAPPTPPPVPATPAAPANLWSFLLPNAAQKSACKTCFCNSPFGQLMSGAAGPMSVFSGGLIPNRCALNSIENDLKKDPGSAEGAAAQIKKDEADAKARREAVRYLGTVDCNYWPEAIEALADALRKDRNECVRFEAALALRNGCCCNERIVKALEACVSMSDKDAPAERSDRVRAAAADALARCPLIMQEIEDGKKNGDIKKTEAVDPTVQFYARVGQMPREDVLASARNVLASLQQANKTPAAGAAAIAPIAPRTNSVSAIISNAFSPSVTYSQPPSVAATQPRQSFFSGLTKQLTGRQEWVIPGRVD